MSNDTFIIDCPSCNAKVAAAKKGTAINKWFDYESGEPSAYQLAIGQCPNCSGLLVGESRQIRFEEYNAEFDEWEEFVRVYPKPLRTFVSLRIPRVVKESLNEAEKCLQANANTAACAMLGRALEAVCRDLLEPQSASEKAEDEARPKKNIMLAAGIKQLKEKKHIDDRLYDWSLQLHAFRNLAAHPEDVSISREDTEDLQSFVYAIVEYVYDLTDRYNDFKERVESRKKKKKKA
jgi:hypothetical protein